MPFPAVRRVLYRKNPLDRVICQLRFPPILRIDAREPADFQEDIRPSFPGFSQRNEGPFAIGPPGSPISEVLSPLIDQSGGKNFEFASEDDKWKINLTRTFMSLTSYEYRRWEEFLENLAIPYNALTKHYAPSYLSRIGLRYINTIKRSELGLKDVPWSELISPTLAGVFADHDVAGEAQKVEAVQEVRINGALAQVRIRTQTMIPPHDNEVCFVVDSDLFVEENTELSDAFDQLAILNGEASKLIQWAISSRLHEAMEPEEVSW